MILSDFSPMIELAVTLNIAFVAVEYVKSYTNAVCNQLFNFAKFLNDSFEECKSLLVDDVTLNSIHDSKINGNSIAGEIEKAKISREKISNEINSELEAFRFKIGNVCQSKSISSVSLWLFMYGLSDLFCMGITSILADNYVELFVSWLTIFTILYTILGWVVGEKGYKMCYLDFTSLRLALCSFAIGLCLSVLFTWLGLLYDKCISIFPFILIVSVLYMYSNFVVSSIMIWNRAAKVKKEIKTNADKYKDKCNKLQHDVNQLLAVHEVELKIEKNSVSTPVNSNISQSTGNRPRKKSKREKQAERQTIKGSTVYNFIHKQ